MKVERLRIEVSSRDRAMILPPANWLIEIGNGLYLIFNERAPAEKVEAFVAAFNDLQASIQDVEAAGRD